MGIGAFIVLLVGAVIVGFVAQALGRAQREYGWLFAAIGAAIGAYVASEWLGVASVWGPEWDGLFVLPALIGAIVLGGIVDLVVRATGQQAAS